MTINNFTPSLWAGRAQANLNDAHVYANTMNRDYEGDFSAMGDRVHIQSIGRPTIRAFTKNAAIQLAKDGIRVNSVHPGPIDTEMIADNIGTPEGLAASVSRIPMGKVGTVDDVAYGVLFLASDESSFMTGSELVIDGGITAQ